MHFNNNNLSKATILQDFKINTQDNTISTAFLDKIKSLCNIIGTVEDALIVNNLQTLIDIFQNHTSYIVFPSTITAYPNSYNICCELYNEIRNYIIFHRNVNALTSITYLPNDWDGIALQTTLQPANYYFFEESTYNAFIQVKKEFAYDEVLSNYLKPINVNYTAGYSDLLTLPSDIVGLLVRGINALRNNTGDGCADCNSVFTDPVNLNVIYKYKQNQQSYNLDAFTVNNSNIFIT